MSQATQMGTELTKLTTKRSQCVIKVWLVRMWEGPPKANDGEGGAWEILFHDYKTGSSYLPPNVSLQLIASVINEEPLQEKVLFDFLAEVVRKEDPKDMVTKFGTNSKRLGLRVEDAEYLYAVGCLVDRIKPYIEEDKAEPLIVAFQLFRVKEWNVILGGKNYRSAVDDLRGGMCGVETIENVLNAEEFGNKWISCEIEDFDVGKNDWCFIACHDCHKKCKKVDDHFVCDNDNCTKQIAEVELRYKLFAYVNDSTGSMFVVLWDTEATQIVGLTAAKLRGLNKEAM
ncbi:hypothetical protein PIB30_026322 [Stylosanthes scabra]|uniref:Replication factor A C-terminal domain-containing protein n=1 Tax=Stylosanthes scabra TaxID=79078 RepID=A0ABU6X7V9_9FABA|nr:hypothetical protein [Stylosanthes scabra]